MLPFNKANKTKYEQLQQKYGFLQKEYSGERTTQMEQYRIENSNSEIAILQNGGTVKANEEIKKSKEQEDGGR